MRRFLTAILAVAALLPTSAAFADQQVENAYPPQVPCEVPNGVNIDRFIDVERATIANPGDARTLVAAFFQAMGQPPVPGSARSCFYPVDAAASLPAGISPVHRAASDARAQCASMTANPKNVDIDADNFYAVVQIVKWGDPKAAVGGVNPRQNQSDQANLKSGDAQAAVHSSPGNSPPAQDQVLSPGTSSPFPANAATPPANVPAPAPTAPHLDLQASADKQAVEKQNWYVYHSGRWSQEDFTTRKHIPGMAQVWLIYLHLNRQSKYKVSYPFEITEVVPAPLQDLFSLLQLAVTARAQAETPINPRVWGGACVPVELLPSTLAIKPTATVVTPADAAATALGDPVTFDDEGPYHWDVSVGVPIHKISELDFSSSGSTVTAKKVDKQNLFALFDYYFVPVDFKRQTFSGIPFLVAGVAITSKPFDRPLLGIGWGTKLASIYVGVVFDKQQSPQTLGTGSQATPGQLSADLKSHRKGQFAFGLHLSAKAVSDLLKKKS
jgi:hypothetical protein